MTEAVAASNGPLELIERHEHAGDRLDLESDVVSANFKEERLTSAERHLRCGAEWQLGAWER